MCFCVRSLSTSFCTAPGVTTVSALPCTMIPEAGQGARKLKSYMLAGGATEMKPRISGRRISSCIPISAPKLYPAIQVVEASGWIDCTQSSAAAALDWVQSIHPEASTTWIAGYSFGALIGMQLLMRRPEIRGFISVSPPANMYDFSFLAPCPASGIIVQGAADTVVTPNAVQKLVDKLRTQKHITIHHEEIPRANHFYETEMDDLMRSVDNYLDMRLSPDCPIR